MSSFILSDKHFQIIAEYIKSESPSFDCQDFANRLKRINIESVNYRYNEKTRFSKVKFNNQFSYSDYDKFDIIRLIQCWSYQSCENAANIDYMIMDAYLLSLFDNNELEQSKIYSTIWSI